MSFWMGFAEALKDSSDKKHQKDMLADERAYAREDFLFRMKEQRRADMEDFIKKRALQQADLADERRYTEGLYEKRRGWEKEDTAEARKYEKELLKEKRDYDRKNTIETLMMEEYIKRGGTAPGSSRSSSSSSTKSSASPEVYIRGLNEIYGVSEESIMRLMESGNKEAPRMLFETLEEKASKYAEDWGDDEEARYRFNTEIVGNTVNGIIQTAPEDVPIFSPQFLDMIEGYDLSPEIAGIMGATSTVPGDVLIPDVTLPKKYEPAELNAINEQNANILETAAIDRVEQIQNEIQRITEEFDRGTVPEEDREVLEQRRKQLIDANLQLKDALKALERGNIARLQQIMGPGILKEQKNYNRDLELAPGFNR